MPYSSSTVIAHLEPPSSRKRLKTGKNGPFWPEMPLLGLSEVPEGPDFVPTAPDWPASDGLMLTTHFDLVLGHFWAPRGPKRAHFCPKCPFWGPLRSSGGPEGPDLVPTAPDWPAWVGLMLTTHLDLVSGPFWAPRGPKRARFCPKCPFWDPRRIPRNQVWSRLPPIVPPRMDSCSPHTLTWYRAPSVSPGGQKGLFGRYP